MCSVDGPLYLLVDTAFQKAPTVFTASGLKAAAHQGSGFLLPSLLHAGPGRCPGVAPPAVPPLGAMVGLPGAQ